VRSRMPVSGGGPYGDQELTGDGGLAVHEEGGTLAVIDTVRGHTRWTTPAPIGFGETVVGQGLVLAVLGTQLDSAHELAQAASFGRRGSLSAAVLLRPRVSAAAPTRAATPAAA